MSYLSILGRSHEHITSQLPLLRINDNSCEVLPFSRLLELHAAPPPPVHERPLGGVMLLTNSLKTHRAPLLTTLY